MKTATVYHGKDGPGLEIEEIPLWALVVQAVIHFLFPVLTLWDLACCHCPEWAWRIGWGKPKPGDVDYDAAAPHYVRHSLGSAAYNWGGWLDAGWLWKHTKPVIRFPLTAGQLTCFPADAKWIAEHEDRMAGNAPAAASQG